MGKFTFYEHFTPEGKKEVIAVSNYFGKVVRGVAKCNPEDEYNAEIGKELAAARCEQKIARLRLQRAAGKYLDAAKAADKAEMIFQDSKEYYMDAFDKLTDANGELDRIYTKLKVE